MSDRPPTLREVAARLGLSNAAVSMALRNHSGVSAQTAARVQAVAKEMGWRPNPLLSAYQAQVRTNRPARYQATIAWVDDLPTKRGDGLAPLRKVMLRAAADHAARFGFKVEPLTMGDLLDDRLEKNADRIRRVLDARGITGFILPVGWKPHHAVLDWDPFAVAVIGRVERSLETALAPMAKPILHHSVAGDAISNARHAFQRLRQLGRRRIGLVLHAYHNIYSDELYHAGVLIEQKELPHAQRLPVLILPKVEQTSPPELHAWLRRHRPDAILCENVSLLDWLREAGLRVPQEVAIAHLSLGPTEAGWSGINEHRSAQAVAAVDIIMGQLMRNEREAPAFPRQVLIRGDWQDGSTT